MSDYDPNPITCVISEHKFGEGMRNCTWSSCREGNNSILRVIKNTVINNLNSHLISGCTTAQVKCHQITVNYTKIPYSEWVKNPRDSETVDWDVTDTRFLINTEGCGYPPRVNCTEFAKKYG